MCRNHREQILFSPEFCRGCEWSQLRVPVVVYSKLINTVGCLKPVIVFLSPLSPVSILSTTAAQLQIERATITPF